MKTIVKTLLRIAYGLLAILGLLATGLLVFKGRDLLLNFPEEGPKSFVGVKACNKSLTLRFLPLPEQADVATFPMALDYCGMCDYSGFIIFRAPADWQEPFRQEHLRKASGLDFDAVLDESGQYLLMFLT